MDHDLTTLRRAAAADPADPALAARLDRALLRGGAQVELMKRYHAAYVRSHVFDTLPGPDPMARRCGCGETVRYQRDRAEAVAALARGECAAVAREELGELLLDMAACDQLSTHPGPRRACLRLSEVPFVDVAALDLAPEVLDLIPASFATTYQVLPIGLAEGRVRVALGPLSVVDDFFVVEDLRFMLNLDVETVFADPAAVPPRIDELYPPEAFGAGYDSEGYMEIACS